MQLPIFKSLAGYDKTWFRGDLIAGLTVWAVLVPEALAYASIAGVSPVVGLYAAPPALILYAAFGSSRHLIVGPMSATAALSAAAVADLTTGGPDEVLAFTGVLAIMTGIFALAAGLLRLGFLANFISEPVLKGFIIGLALTIIIGQVPKLLGIEKRGGQLLRAALGRDHQPRRHARPHAARRCRLAGDRARVPPLRPGCSRFARRRHLRGGRRQAVRPRRQGCRHRRRHRQRAAGARHARRGGRRGLPAIRRSGRRTHARRLCRRARGGEDVRGACPLRDRCRTAS